MNVPIRRETITVLDPRHAFLARAAARLTLLKSGDMSLDQAFDDLIEPFLNIVFPRPYRPADAHWDNPGWAVAAADYHRDRKWRRR